MGLIGAVGDPGRQPFGAIREEGHMSSVSAPAAAIHKVLVNTLDRSHVRTGVANAFAAR